MSLDLDTRRATDTPTMERLLSEYHESGRQMESPVIERFEGCDDEGVDYNCSPSVQQDGITYRVSRREHPEDEFSSRAPFYRLVTEDDLTKWRRDETISNLEELGAGKIWQDPSIKVVAGMFVASVIEVNLIDPANPERGSRYCTRFFWGEDLGSMRPLVDTPELQKMKVPIELADGRIGWYTRAQSPGNPSRGGKGKIGFVITNTLSDITPEIIYSAPLLKRVLSSNSVWYGVNDTELMENGDVGILWHMGREVPTPDVPNARQYAAATMLHDPISGDVYGGKIVGLRSSLEGDYPYKNDALIDVEYPSEFARVGGRVRISAGLSDACQIHYYTEDTFQLR